MVFVVLSSGFLLVSVLKVDKNNLMLLQLRPDSVAHYFIPFDFGSGHGQGPPQGLERRVGHRLVVL